MTENEIKNTKEWIEDFIETYALSNQETINPETLEFKKLVVCLEELQQYRAIGTVKQIMEMQFATEQEHDEVLKYRAIGTVRKGGVE